VAVYGVARVTVKVKDCWVGTVVLLWLHFLPIIFMPKTCHTQIYIFPYLLGMFIIFEVIFFTFNAKGRDSTVTIVQKPEPVPGPEPQGSFAAFSYVKNFPLCKPHHLPTETDGTASK
jgi:hypothetical protein